MSFARLNSGPCLGIVFVSNPKLAGLVAELELTTEIFTTVDYTVK